jgi:hypothetical protein
MRKKPLFILLLVIALFLMVVLPIMISCQKHLSQTMAFTEDLREVEWSARERAPKPQAGLFFLDFDGYQNYEPANATPADMQEIKAGIETSYKKWQITVTLDSQGYAGFHGLRQRLVFTNSGIGVMGASAIGSMVEGTETPSLVNWAYSRYHAEPNKLVVRLATHEAGHTLGLYHTVDSCGQLYAMPNAAGWVPVMGNVMDALTISFTRALSDQCIEQDDEGIISRAILLKRK